MRPYSITKKGIEDRRKYESIFEDDEVIMIKAKYIVQCTITNAVHAKLILPHLKLERNVTQTVLLKPISSHLENNYPHSSDLCISIFSIHLEGRENFLNFSASKMAIIVSDITCILQFALSRATYSMTYCCCDLL